MKILILSNNPVRASFRQRIGVYLPFLRAEGIDCDVEQFPQNYVSRWKLFLRANKYDGVLLHKKTLNLWDAAVLRNYARSIIYDFDDAVMYGPHHPDALHSSHQRLFQRTTRLADSIIAGNAWLADKARLCCSQVHILPTGLDTKKYNVPRPQTDGKIRLVWIGSKATLGYLNGLSPVLEQIGQMYPQVILRIICDTFFDLSSMPVEKRQWSLDTESADLAACDIGLCPLPDDNYTRGKCGFKLLQYFASGLPAVASPVGVNVDFISKQKTGYLAATEQDWIKHLSFLIENAQLRQEMGRQAQTFVGDYDTRVLGAALCKIIREAVL